MIGQIELRILAHVKPHRAHPSSQAFTTDPTNLFLYLQFSHYTMVTFAFGFKTSKHTRFKRLIAFCVLANSFLLSLKWKYESEEAKILASGSCFFSFIFILEVLIKLLGMGMRGMCQSYRNTADLLITERAQKKVFSQTQNGIHDILQSSREDSFNPMAFSVFYISA